MLGYYELAPLLYAVYSLGSLFSLLVLFQRGSALRSYQLPLGVSCLFAAIYALTATYTISVDYFPKLLLVLMLPFYFLTGVELVLNRTLCRRFFGVLIAVMAILSVYTLLNLAAFDFSYNNYFRYSDATNKVDYLTLSIYAFLCVVYMFEHSQHPWLAVPVGGVILLAAVLSGARGPLIFFVALLMCRLLLRKGRDRSALLVGLVGLLVAGTLSLTDSIYYESVLYRFGSIGAEDESMGARYQMWQTSLDFIQGHPFLGGGINSAGTILFGDEDGFLRHPHNYLLEVWLEGGILLLVLAGSITYFGLRRAIPMLGREGASFAVLFLFVLLNMLKSQTVADARLFFLFLGAVCLQDVSRTHHENHITHTYNRPKVC
jgi:O-antigen ligase